MITTNKKSEQHPETKRNGDLWYEMRSMSTKSKNYELITNYHLKYDPT